MSARDSTEEEAIQELSELNLRAHTQSVGLTGYDPFERLWNHNPNNLEMMESDATPTVKTNLLPPSANNAFYAQAVTVDPVPNASTASPNSCGHLRSSPQQPTAKFAITNQREEGRQPVRTVLSDDRMLVDTDTENLEQNVVLQSEKSLALQPKGYLDIEGNKASLRSFSSNEPGTEKKKSVAEFFRENLPKSHSANSLRRNACDKQPVRPNELDKRKGSPWSHPTGGVITVEEEPNICPLDKKPTRATRGRRPAANSRSSLSMLVFATWSLLTWKTAIAPTGLWGIRSKSYRFSSVSSLPNLVRKPTIREEQSNIFPNPFPREFQDL